MEVIAKETGGKAYINTNGLQEAVADAVRNGSSYYTIAYVPRTRTSTESSASCKCTWMEAA